MSKPINLRKRFSVDLAKLLEQPLKDYYGIFKILDKKDNYLIYLKDIDDNSDMFFSIIKETNENQGHIVYYSCKPFNNADKESHSNTVKIEHFIPVLTMWLENLKFYEQDSILNDPLLRGYQKEFYNDFKIADENADYEGFDYFQQQKLEAYFEKVEKGIDNFKDGKNVELIEELRSDIIGLQECVTTETKNGQMKKFSFLLAKARKGSIKICNFILKVFFEDFIKDGAKLAFNYAINNADKIPDYIQQIQHYLLN
jgi:hypothetical protein